MIWHNPEAFFLLPLLAAVFLYRSFFPKKRSKGALFYADLTLFSGLSSLRSSLVFLPKLLQLGGLFCVVMALARPQTTEHFSHQSQEGVDIMLVMDISLSMLVADMGHRATRLKSAKNVVGEFVRGRPHDRIGLIVFSGESFTVTPLTFDHALLNRNLAQVSALSSIKDGTAIGVALANAAVRLKHSPENSRLIIFLTDGENNTGFVAPETALQIVKQNKIKVYTIGLGNRSGTFPIRYEERDAQGARIYKKAWISSRINKDLMRKISTETNGLFFMAENLVSLRKIFKTIDEMETYPIQLNQWTKREERFQNFLLPGLIMCFLSFLLSLTVFFKGV